ncbi:periphilin-1-like isoform X1 [Peromyscus eremicus]|uniref:periphilin-1-like isoform X1 n=1 Tax=Peromyscus eremicus TaxID=42410 RepID=UPI0027DE8A51|nr:periphilin-1-like isoform X1 [Peromyscus eremicus]
MWSEGWYYKRLPGKQAPPCCHPSDGNHRLINVPKRPPLGDKRSSLLARPDEGGYSRYYCHVDYQKSDEGRCFSQNPRSGPPYQRGPYGYRWSRDEYATSRQPQYRVMRNGFRRRHLYSSHYSRQRSPHKWGAPFWRESRVGRKDSLHSRFGSSLSSRSRMRSFHQSRHRCKERAIQFLKTSRDTVPSGSSSKTGSKAPLCINQTEEPESNTTAGTELCEDSQLSSRSKVIASKITEIEKVYRQVCETFGMVVERLVEKDRSLEKSIQFAMKQSLHEIGEQHVEELKHFIMEYDNSTPDFGGPF